MSREQQVEAIRDLFRQHGIYVYSHDPLIDAIVDRFLTDELPVPENEEVRAERAKLEDKLLAEPWEEGMVAEALEIFGLAEKYGEGERSTLRLGGGLAERVVDWCRRARGFDARGQAEPDRAESINESRRDV